MPRTDLVLSGNGAASRVVHSRRPNCEKEDAPELPKPEMHIVDMSKAEARHAKEMIPS